MLGSKHFAFTFRRHGVVGILDALKQGALSRVPFIDRAENSIEPSCIIVFEQAQIEFGLGTFTFVAFVATFLEEWLDGFGKDSGGGVLLLLFLGVFLGLFCHLDGITIPTAHGFITLEFVPSTRAQP